MRRARFKLAGKFDGTPGATVVIEQEGDYALFRVRPARRRREFVLQLSDVARGVIFDVVRAELREKKAQRRRGRQ